MSEEMITTKDDTLEPVPTINSEQTISTQESVMQMQSAAEPVPQPKPAAEPVPQPRPAAEPIPQPKPAAEQAPQPAPVPVSEADSFENDFPEEPAEEQRPKHRFFRSRSSEADFSRDQWILSRIDDAHMMEYLTLEQRRFEQIQAAKEKRERRIFTAFRLTISLAAIVAVVYLLKDNPTILVNILYIAGILAAIWFLKNPKDKEKTEKTN